MFTLKLHLLAPWDVLKRSPESGSLQLTLVKHPAIRSLCNVDEDRVEIMIWESSRPLRRSDYSDSLHSDFSSARRSVRILLSRKHPRGGRIDLSEECDFFLYATVHEGTLHVSYDPRKSLPAHFVVNRSALAAHIVFNPLPATETCVEGLHRLMPNTNIMFNVSGIFISTLGEYDFVQPMALTQGADATEAISQILIHEIAAHPNGVGVVEFSGGMDSALVAVCAASTPFRPEYSACLVQLDDAGKQQRTRRAELNHLLNYKNVEIECRRAFPFHSSACRHPFDGPEIWDSPYVLGTMAWIDELEQELGICGGLTVYTGIGGDELYFASSVGQKDTDEFDNCEHLRELVSGAAWEALHELPTKGPSSAQTAAMGRARAFFERDAIPVNPLCVSSVYAFFQSLPISARLNKSIARTLMSRRGLSDYFIYPHLTEDFSAVFNQSRAAFDFQAFFGRDPLLMEFGIIDVPRMLRGIERDDVACVALRAIRAEAWLRSIADKQRQRGAEATSMGR